LGKFFFFSNFFLNLIFTAGTSTEEVLQLPVVTAILKPEGRELTEFEKHELTIILKNPDDFDED
jgi:hypothetical protein